MAKLLLEKTRIQAGVWEGILTLTGEQDDAPMLEVTHLTQPIEGVTVSPDPDQPGAFQVQVPIPAEALSDGIQTFVIADKSSGTVLDSFSVVTGQPLDHDIRAEVNLLREELDMLKRAFRRHCMDSGQV